MAGELFGFTFTSSPSAPSCAAGRWDVGFPSSALFDLEADSDDVARPTI